MPISEVIASRVPTMLAKPAIDSQAKLVATAVAKPSLDALAKDTLMTAADKAGGALAASAENPGPVAKGFWWLFNKATGAIIDAVHKAAYGH